MVKSSSMTSRNWFLFLISFFCFLASVALLNLLIDPYGHYGTGLLGSSQDIRSWMVLKLQRQYRFPDVLLFGSSRCLPFKLNLDKDIKFMNVALAAGAIEDHYCFLRYVVDELNFPVRLALVGLEPDLLVSTHPFDPLLKKNKVLGKYLESKSTHHFADLFSPPSYIEDVRSLLSLSTLKDSFRIIFQEIVNHFGIREASAGEASVEIEELAGNLLNKFVEEKDSMEARLRQYRSLYAGGVSIDSDRLLYLHRFAEFSKKKGIRVVVFAPGYSQEFWNQMSQIDGFLKIHRLFEAEIRKLQAEYGWDFIDFRPGHWIGEKLEFFDGVHPTKPTVHLINKIMENYLKNAL